MRLVIYLCVSLLAAIPPAAPVSAQELIVSAAIATKQALEELGRGFMARRPGVVLRYNFGASGDLQKQIEAGAPIDLFISAGQRQMDELQRRSLIVAETRRNLASNVLAAIKPVDSRLDISKPGDLLDSRVLKIAIGNPKTVPAGERAAESLRTLGLWEPLLPKLVLAENVRQVLEFVARGDVDAGFVWVTDVAVRQGEVIEVFRPSEETYRPAVYTGAVVAASRRRALTQALLDFLVSPEGQAVFSRTGFRRAP